MDKSTPLFPCKQLGATLGFYRALGFEVTHEQEEPYLYGAVRLGSTQLHFANLSVYGAKNAFGASLLFVDDVAACHRAFADGLRAKYGKVPTADHPRRSRLRRHQTRFTMFDPSGNLLIVIARDEAEAEYSTPVESASPLASALENALFFRDTYANDKTAANLLQGALQRDIDATAIERVRALAALAEMAVALGDASSAQRAREELRRIPLTEAERAQFIEELEAADRLERWIVESPT